MEASPTSHTPAHARTATVAPFRAWRSSQLLIAGGPARSAIKMPTESSSAAGAFSLKARPFATRFSAKQTENTETYKECSGHKTHPLQLETITGATTHPYRRYIGQHHSQC